MIYLVKSWFSAVSGRSWILVLATWTQRGNRYIIRTMLAEIVVYEKESDVMRMKLESLSLSQ